MIDPLARLPRTRGLFRTLFLLLLILRRFSFFVFFFLFPFFFLPLWSLVRIAEEEEGKKKNNNKRTNEHRIRNFEIFFEKNFSKKIRDSGRIENEKSRHSSSSEWRRRVTIVKCNSFDDESFSNLFFSRPRWWKSLATRRLLGACLFFFFTFNEDDDVRLLSKIGEQRGIKKRDSPEEE